MAKADCISSNHCSFASLEPVLRPIEMGGADYKVTVNAEYFDAKKCSAEDIAELCCRQESIETAMQTRLVLSPPPPEMAIYIIGPPDERVCKIGVAMNPGKRLSELQIGCWKPLAVHGLFWFIDGPAYGVEALSHRIADRMGKRLQGEWVDMDAGGAAYIVGSVIHSTERVKVADSAMWLRQRKAILNVKCERAMEAEENAVPNGLRQSNLTRAHIRSGEVEPATTLKR